MAKDTAIGHVCSGVMAKFIAVQTSDSIMCNSVGPGCWAELCKRKPFVGRRLGVRLWVTLRLLE